MQAESITIRVPPDVKRAYESAPEAQRKLAQDLFEALFRKRKPGGVEGLRILAEKASAEARSKGLTEQKPNEILGEG